MRAPFPKDIVIIDFESSHPDLEKTKPLQFAAIRLDRVTLEEKQSFRTYIRIDLHDVTPQRLLDKGIDPADLEKAPTSREVAQAFAEKFGKDFLLSSWAANLDSTLFRRMMVDGGINPSEFDYHIFDLWPVAYTYLLKQGYTGSLRSEPMFQELGLPPRGAHDALEDCRHAAEVMRMLLKD